MEVKKSIAEEICKELLELTYTDKSYSDGKPYNAHFILNRADFTPRCIGVINNKFLDINTELATLRAKVIAYEAILKNSNFAMAVIPEPKPTAEDPS